MPRDTPTPWHRLFGMALTDLFTGRPWRVELELELALKSQRLDVLIIERLTGQAATLDPAALEDLPDGLDTLGAHNILTYKSAQETLDAWAVDELIGHYVTYRKLASAQATTASSAASDPERGTGVPQPGQRLLPVADFCLYAVATRHPARLLGQLHPSARRPTAWPGVYDLTWGHRTIRLIVLNAIAEHPRNAPWELFASEMTRIRAGLAHFQPHSPAARLLRYHLSQVHRLELTDMSYTVDDFKRDTWRLMLKDLSSVSAEERGALLEQMDTEDRLSGLSPEERLRGLPPEERLRGLPPEERLRGLPPEERLRGLPPEERLRGLPPEERLRGLPPEERLRGLDPAEVLKRYAPEERLRGMDPEQIKAWLKRTGH
ncbi:hypothetical protein [uncultured Thiodictyon sp.]|uniref:hypothetical protein n=1 Tax=uncultured Thiodictyon sp. TaxID=1846217 RepID=UPI0025F97DEE|nr:hypothetical protein [uncultured Thiodictyon sp.]